MKALYLEPDEEITSVVDRLKEIDDEEVAIVVPKRAGLLQSIVNLKLLRYQAEQQKKRISLVTTDKTGRNLAAAVGLTVYQKLPEGQVKGRIPAPTESAVREPAPEIPIKFRKQPPPEPVRTPVKDAEPDADMINYKKGATPEIITKAVSGEESSAAEIPVTAVPESPATEPEAKPETTKRAPAEDGPSPSAKESKESPAAGKSRRSVRSLIKLPAVKLPKIKRSKVTDVREKAAAATSKRRLLWKIGAAVLAALLIAGGAAAAVMLPKATITVTPKTTPIKAQIPLTFSAHAAAADPNANIIPAKTIVVTKEVTRQVSATGHAGGGKAAGDITVVNNLSRNQALVTQTRFQSPDGRIFRAQSGVVVPAGGQTTVRVEAEEGGAGGNLPAGTKLTVPGLHGTTSVYGQVGTALTGGTDSSTTTISEADVTRAKQDLSSQAAQEGIADAKSKLAVGYTIDPKIAATNVLSSSVNPAAGTTATKFTVSGKVKVTYFTYQPDDFKRVFNADLNAKVPAGSALVDQRTDTFVASQTSEDQLSGNMNVDTSAATNVSPEKVKATIRGKRPADARAALEADGQITNVQVALWPFWVMSVPGSDAKIVVHFQSGSGAAGPSPSPSASASVSVSPAP